MSDRPTNDKEITTFFHCGMCLSEFKEGKAPGESPESYARISAGFTPKGLQLWCVRHDVNMANIDFEGHKHPANTTRKGDH